MRYTTFRYNPRTCQYERVRLRPGNVVWYCLGVLMTAACMLAGILVLHDLFVNTPSESALRKANTAMRDHHALLTKELNTLKPLLASLEHKDTELHTKFFGSPPAIQSNEVDPASKQKLLLEDADVFGAHVLSLKERTRELITRSTQTNQYFRRGFSNDQKIAESADFLPVLQPIRPMQADRLITGFGMRVNPFHKGLYEHLGVDIAASRGTPVTATASGTVVRLKRSDLQAGYGNYIEIDHGNGLLTRYAHLEDIIIRYGAKVVRGDTIGTVGSSGGSVAPHLHYEIIRDRANVDPIAYMIEGLNPSEHSLLTAKSHQQNQSLD